MKGRTARSARLACRSIRILVRVRNTLPQKHRKSPRQWRGLCLFRHKLIELIVDPTDSLPRMRGIADRPADHEVVGPERGGLSVADRPLLIVIGDHFSPGQPYPDHER